MVVEKVLLKEEEPELIVKAPQKVNQITNTLDAAIEGHKVSKGDLIWNLLTSRFRNKDE